MNWRSKLYQTRISVDDRTRRRHLDAIEAAISDRVRYRRPGRALAVAVALVLAIPVMAVAADQAEPGDFLYPVRQLFQPVPKDAAQNQDTVTVEFPPADVVIGDNATRDQPEVPEHPVDTRPPSSEPPDTRPPFRETTTTTIPERGPTTTTIAEPTTTTEPGRTPPTAPPRGS